MVETHYVVEQRLGSMLEDLIEVVRFFSRLILLVNCSMNLLVRIARERMDPLGRLMYHCRAGPVKVEPKPLRD